MVNPITHSSHSLLAHVKRREQDASGYPLMTSAGDTLVHAIVNIIYQVQDKEPWNKAISQVSHSTHIHTVYNYSVYGYASVICSV